MRSGVSVKYSILEATGRYYDPVVMALQETGFFVSTVNPKLIVVMPFFKVFSSAEQLLVPFVSEVFSRNIYPL